MRIENRHSESRNPHDYLKEGLKMFKDIKIGAKLYILMGVFSLILILVGVIGLKGERETDASLEDIYDTQRGW